MSTKCVAAESIAKTIHIVTFSSFQYKFMNHAIMDKVLAWN